MIDVDGSYLFRKERQLSLSTSDDTDTALPTIPLSGWEPIDDSNYQDMGKKIPLVCHGKVITLLYSC